MAIHPRNEPRKPYLVEPSTLERFKKANGYEVFEVAGILAAASASGLHYTTVSRILKQHPLPKFSKN
jgi:hypothetical protein